MTDKNVKTVYVAMSGGVDSSVAAGLLKKQGFGVAGVFMKPWSASAEATAGQSSRCPWKQDREDAMRVAAKLGIPLLTWDFSREYKKAVTDYMIREYRAGRTPNPDVMCNKKIKFGLFLEKALKEGADFIATGHYVQLRQHTLLKARDKNKDQSYFLWTLDQKQLKHCLFPIGEYTKPEVRKLARKFGLPTADKKDSQGVCFVGPLDMKDFLKSYIRPKKGKILDKDGRIIGPHDGVFYYTVGQRHGLNIGNGRGPYYVVGKDIKRNAIYVGEKRDLLEARAKISGLRWVNGGVSFPALIDVRTRYRAPLAKAVLYKNGDLKFKTSERAITPGQSAVFYRGRELLGGGVIEKL